MPNPNYLAPKETLECMVCQSLLIAKFVTAKDKETHCLGFADIEEAFTSIFNHLGGQALPCKVGEGHMRE